MAVHLPTGYAPQAPVAIPGHNQTLVNLQRDHLALQEELIAALQRENAQQLLIQRLQAENALLRQQVPEPAPIEPRREGFMENVILPVMGEVVLPYFESKQREEEENEHLRAVAHRNGWRTLAETKWRLNP